ncbi:MAG: serine hydrolase [Planctomycetes bacterium]|nr:serine hydrolase [Planctomycetota bacterium]
MRCFPSILVRRRSASLVLLVLSVWRPPAPAAAADLKDRLEPLIERHRGKVAVAVRHLGSGESYTHRGDEPMPTASLIKVAVMIEAYRRSETGELDLNRTVTLRDEDKVQGSGILTPHFSAGTTLSVRDLVRLMIAWSDNTATNLVLDQVGLEAVNDGMQSLDCPNTRIHAKVFRGETSIDPERSKRFGLGSTTAGEMLSLLERLHGGEIVSKAASAAMLEHLAACQDRAKLPRDLPAGTKVAHKTGSVSAVRTDAGIVNSPSGPIAICVLTAENEDRRWTDENAAEKLCGAIGRSVYRHFNTIAVPAGDFKETLAVGDSGRLVEDLQRTLNARLQPSPELSIDGEFGPATRAAVVRFQESQELATSGSVGPETWSKLGPLVTSDPPVPDAEAANTQDFSTEPPDALTGPPFVTCEAWAILDGRGGEFLWGANETRPLDMASTTKIMTAWLVLELARRQPEVLDERLTFSQRADDTPGSTAGLRAGESVPVREVLYGLLLPSGNDAAVALAEHFGDRVHVGDTAGASGIGTEDAVEAPRPNGRQNPLPPLDERDRFVAAMNRAAGRLGLHETRFANPHGLTAKEHRASARDLARLAWTAMQNPLFCQYVGTRQRGAAVTGPTGYRRNVLWKNTNNLLPVEGYEGVKTGTTGAAGACLVSCGVRDNERLIVVVLGSSSSEARYVDSRNLYRWAWLQRTTGATDAD